MNPIRRAKITKAFVESLKPTGTPYVVKDTGLPGFMLRVSATGEVTFYAYYRVDGVQRRPALGRYHAKAFPVDGTPEKPGARQMAEDYIHGAKHGRDLSGERKEARAAETFEAFTGEYLQVAKGRLKPRSFEEDARRLRLHLIPAWSKRKVASIGRADVDRLMHKLAEKRVVKVKASNADMEYTRQGGGRIGANRVLALIRGIFRLAEERGIIPAGSNPARFVKPFKETMRKRKPDPGDIQAVAQAIREIEAERSATPWAIAAVKMILYTGARKTEILSLRWEHVDAEARCLRLADSKTGERRVPLNAPAMEVLAELAKIKESGNPWVFCGHKHGERLVNVAKTWERIRRKAGVPSLRIHDLRHWIGGIGAMLGLSLPTIGRVLGHRQAATTDRYIDFCADPVATASEAIGQALLAAMQKGKAEVIDIGGKADVSEAAKGGR